MEVFWCSVWLQDPRLGRQNPFPPTLFVPVQSQFCLGVFSETAHIYRITRTKYLLIEVWIYLSVPIFISLKLPNFLFLARTCGSGSRLEKSNLCRGLLIDRGAAFSLMVQVENSDLKVTKVSDVLFMLCHVSFLKKWLNIYMPGWQ